MGDSREGLRWRHPQTRWLALAAMVAATLLGCDARTHAPSGIAPIGAKPSADITSSDGSTVPCSPNSRACGEFQARVGRPASNPYVNISTQQLGAWARTWSPTKETAYMSVKGRAIVRRGTRGQGNYREVPYDLIESNTATETGDGISSPHTCEFERNEVVGSSKSSAQGGDLYPPIGWIGTFSDSDYCEAPSGNELACDENGMPVDEGGDPANCDPGTGGDSDGGSGIQFYPGDYTDGETVNFWTGIGNGGQSVCGQAAQVEQVDISFWDSDTNQWGDWMSGYATTC